MLRAAAHEVRVTARDFAQTVALCERFGIEHEVIGRHRGGRLAAKARRPGRPLAGADALGAAQRRFDLALGHGSNDVTVAARLLRIPCSTMFDYEWATVQHNVNCRLAQAVVVPEAIPPERLDRYGARRKLRALPGAQGGVLPRRLRARPGGARPSSASIAAAADRRRAHAAVGLALPPLRERRLRRRARSACAARRPSCCRAWPSSARRAASGFIVPEQAIDAQSLIAFADLVVCAGGTMNREAVALGTPVWTTFEGRLGAVDERLIAEGRLRRLERRRRARAGQARARSGRRARAPRSRAARRPALLARRLTAAPQGARPGRR